MFVNPLKNDTPEVILKLKNAQIFSKIVSGDNILTSVETGIQANILSPNSYVCVLEHLKDENIFDMKFLNMGVILKEF